MMIVTTVKVISFLTIKNNQKEKDYLNMFENVKTASELYLKKDTNFKTQLDETKLIILPIKRLIDEGF